MSVTSVINKIMSKMKENKRKVVFKNNEASHSWKRVHSFYENAILVVKTRGNAPYVFTTKMGTSAEGITLTIQNEMYSGSIEFADTELNDTWEYLYGYMADEDSALLFYGEKEMTEEVGIRCTIGVGSDVYHIKKEALQVAALINCKLPNEIFKLEATELGKLEDFSLGFN